jgi:hypothetical protein
MKLSLTQVISWMYGRILRGLKMGPVLLRYFLPEMMCIAFICSRVSLLMLDAVVQLVMMEKYCGL